MAGGGTENQPGGGGGPAPWFQGTADADTVAYLQNRGWADKPADQVALEAIKAHREASSALGKFGATDPARIAVLPDPAKPEEGAAFWEKMGRPKDVTGYDLSAAKFADGKAPTEFLSAFAAKALELNLPKGTAEALAGFVVADMEKGVTSTADAARLAGSREALALEANWGTNTAEFKMLAQKGAAAVGWDQATFEGLQANPAVGYAKTMELMRQLGQMSSEGRFVGSQLGGSQPGVMTATEAAAKKGDLIGNPEWLKDFSTNSEKQKQLRDLDEVIVMARAGQYRGAHDSHG